MIVFIILASVAEVTGEAISNKSVKINYLSALYPRGF